MFGAVSPVDKEIAFPRPKDCKVGTLKGPVRPSLAMPDSHAFAILRIVFEPESLIEPLKYLSESMAPPTPTESITRSIALGIKLLASKLTLLLSEGYRSLSLLAKLVFLLIPHDQYARREF